MKKLMGMMSVALAMGLGLSAQAEERAWPWSPVGIGLAAPLQIPLMDSDVYGLRLDGFFGHSASVYGLDLGVAGMCTEDFIGLQGAAMTWTEGNACGLQVSSLANVVHGRATGVQVGSVNVVWDDAVGVQLGSVNYTVNMRGLQVANVINWNNLASYGLEISPINANQMEFTGAMFGGIVNYADSARGFSCGFVNVAYDYTGCQLGVVNACDHMHGVQIGFINLICGSKLPIMVVANAWF